MNKFSQRIYKVGFVDCLMVSKRGSEKYYIIISLILGLMVLALGLFFIFNEFFTEGELDWERCRQSIILRANLPEADLKALKLDMKGAFPLKCKTEVVEIDSAEPEEVYGKISEAVAEGWYMFGEGKFDFVHNSFTESESLCMAFARIHYTQDAIDGFYEELGIDEESFARAFDVPDDVDVVSRSYSPESIMALGSMVDFTKGFTEYYLTEKVPGTSEIYQKYLPILSRGQSNSPYLLLRSDVVPRDSDIILIYKIGTPSVLAGSWFGNIATATGAAVITVGALVLAPVTLGGSVIVAAGAVSAIGTVALDLNYWGDEDFASELAKQRYVVMVSADDDLKVVAGCDKFLTIPA